MSADVIILLQILQTKGMGLRSLSRILETLGSEGRTLEEFAKSSQRELMVRYRFKPEMADSFHLSRDSSLRLYEQLQSRQIGVLVKGGSQYPARLQEILRDSAPPVLFVKGNLEILTKPGVGFCGSRKSSKRGIEATQTIAQGLALHDMNVISGYAVGVDMAAHVTALKRGGVTTLVLAEGILNFVLRDDLRETFNDSNALLLSQFVPNGMWLVGNAMQRNETICALSNAVVLIESGATGGTYAAGESALKLRRPLFVLGYDKIPPSAEGNKYFLEKGASPIKVENGGQIKIDDLLRMAKTDHEKRQLSDPGTSLFMKNPELKDLAKSGVSYPKRLIEVDLPIKRISAHARREKSIRHGHISTLHIWWARRPLAACRAVICASLWPDPADPLCPQEFRDKAAKLVTDFAVKAATSKLMESCSQESVKRWMFLSQVENKLDTRNEAHLNILRNALLDFIADFANWDNSTVKEYLETSRSLTQAAHEALGGEPGTRPLVVDPFAGGGSIPLEALRVGADAFASDLNPVAVLLNKVVLEYIPKYGQRLADEVRKWGEWIKKEAEKELAEFYPKDPDGATPIAYLWARTIKCEGPGCGTTVPLLRSLELSHSDRKVTSLKIVPRPRLKRIDFEIRKNVATGDANEGTVRRSSCVCPNCGYATPAENVRKQFIPRQGGADDSMLIAVVLGLSGGQRIDFRLPADRDSEAFDLAKLKLESLNNQRNGFSAVPDESLPYLRSIFNVNLLGIDKWGKLHNSRQLLAIHTLISAAQRVYSQSLRSTDPDFEKALATCLGFSIDRCADYWSSLAVWANNFVAHTFGRQALGIIWDYAEVCGFSGGSGSYLGAVDWIARVIERESLSATHPAQVEKCSATEHVLPDDCVQSFITDPPYYDAVPYADLSDFFYVWLKRSIGKFHPGLFDDVLSPKEGEIVQLAERNPMYAYKTQKYFEDLMTEAMSEGRRILVPSGIGVVVFAHKTTSGWETQLEAMIRAGWVVTGSWPIDTERPGRLRANNAAALASSIHLICRPRENPDGSVRTDQVGDWREVLAELPKRIHEWMPRLAQEGVVGADAIFACLGPALEIFSRYSRVEKASGEQVTLKEYLEHVWAAVAKEALALVFEGADTAAFEEDARLTAMWLWTLRTDQNGSTSEGDDEENEDDDEESKGRTKSLGGYVLEYDAARKIAQGLGAHLEQLTSLIEVKGDKARLLPVEARARYLFGKDSIETQSKRKKKEKQADLFEIVDEAEELGPKAGKNTSFILANTVLDRVHQSMLLFATGRSEALRRFLVDDGVGRDQRFWKLAQSLSALYPKESDEKRWVDGMLARKKGLGF